MSLQALAERPFDLLLELEQRARAAIAAREGAPAAADEWVGIGFRIGAERFVTTRGDVREVLPVPEQVTRVPGAKPWLRGIANLRGQLLTVVDLKSFLGAGSAATERQARVLIVASRDVPTGLIVDEVVGFRRFGANEYKDETPAGRDPLRALSRRVLSSRLGSLAAVQFVEAARGRAVPDGRRDGQGIDRRLSEHDQIESLAEATAAARDRPRRRAGRRGRRPVARRRQLRGGATAGSGS